MPERPDPRQDFGPAPEANRPVRGLGLLPLLVFVAGLCFVLSLVGVYLSRQPGAIASLWLANAAAVAAIAGRHPREWLPLLAAAGGANLAANLLAGDSLSVAATFLPGNLCQIFVGVGLLHRFCPPALPVDRPETLVRAVLLGGIVPIVLGATLGAGLLSAGGFGSIPDLWLSWALGSGIGTVSLLPFGLLVAARGGREMLRELARPEVMAVVAGALAVTLWSTASVPFPFVYISAALVVAAWVGGFAGTALASLFCSVAVSALIAWGIFLPPPSTGEFGVILFYLPLVLVVVGPLLLAASLETVRRQVGKSSAERNLMAITLNSISEGVVTTDTEGRVAYLNPVAETLMGIECDDARGRDFEACVKLIDGVTGAALPDPIRQCLDGTNVAGPTRLAALHRRQGEDLAVQFSVAPICDGADAVLGTVMVLRDETEARALAARTAYLVHHDSLTGLPNRILFQDRLLHACQTGERNAGRFAVMFLDLDHFKHVNDSLGHAAGDELLRAMGGRLTGVLRQSDTVCRLGGDEFVILLGVLSRSDDAAEVARKILREVSRPCLVDGSEFNISATLGISVFPEDGSDPDTLMKHADAAMYRAKREGRNRSQFFSRVVDEAAVARLRLEGDMRRALLGGQFRVFYQPIVDGLGGRAIGVEALCRWIVGGRESHGPDVFIPIAEETRMILPLGSFVLRQACMQLRSWEGTALSGLTMSVNISTVQLGDPTFVEVVIEILRSTGVAGSRLVFEITESALTADPDGVAGVLIRLRRLGIRVAIDDFGTGYANLSYLKRFPVDCIKIDRSFVSDLDHDAADCELVKVIVAMARNLGLKVIAEGVETVAQATILNALHCPAMQGYLFARPADSATTRRWLERYIGAAPSVAGDLSALAEG